MKKTIALFLGFITATAPALALTNAERLVANVDLYPESGVSCDEGTTHYAATRTMSERGFVYQVARTTRNAGVVTGRFNSNGVQHSSSTASQTQIDQLINEILSCSDTRAL